MSNRARQFIATKPALLPKGTESPAMSHIDAMQVLPWLRYRDDCSALIQHRLSAARRSNGRAAARRNRKKEKMNHTSAKTYDPNQLFDSLHERLRLKNDAALSRKLDVAPSVISKARHLRIPVSAALLIRMHEITGMSIHEMKILLGDRRCKQRLR